jgi:hypothetical protein
MFSGANYTPGDWRLDMGGRRFSHLTYNQPRFARLAGCSAQAVPSIQVLDLSAGKSTIIKMLTPSLVPGGGTVRLLGRDPYQQWVTWKLKALS